MGLITNPVSGLSLAEAMSTEQLIPANNLADIPDRVAALSNLTGHRSASLTVTALAGTANVSTVTVQVVDLQGVAVAGVHQLTLYTASDAAGTTISGTAYSGSLVATSGKILVEITAKHYFEVTTDTTGKFVGSLTDTAKTADFIAVKKPNSAGIIVSPAAAYG